MKKILFVLALVLMMAPPAFAETYRGTVTIEKPPGMVWDKSSRRWVPIETAVAERDAINNVCTEFHIMTPEEEKAQKKLEAQKAKEAKRAAKAEKAKANIKTK